MTSSLTAVRADPRPTRSRRLPAGIALYLQASMLLTFMAGSTVPTPIYAIYQAEWGFSPITTTLVFGVYAMAVLTALLIVGALSDHVGRRPVLIVTVLLQAATMLIFASAGGVPELMVARVIQGLSTGAAVGALGAGMVDLNRAKGTIANAIGPMAGVAIGGIGAGLLVQYLPAPTHLVYLVLFAILLVQAVGVLLMPESVTRKPGALASLKPEIGVPAAARRPLLVAAPALVAVWALMGFFGSLGPALLRVVTGSNSAVLGGLALFTLAAGAAVTTLVLRSTPTRRVMGIGTVALFVGVGITLSATIHTSAVVLFVGTVVAGIGFGAGFQGALRSVLPLAEAHERAGVLSTIYVLSYLALGLPAVIAGFLVVHAGGVLTTAREYSVAVMVLAALALVGVSRTKTV